MRLLSVLVVPLDALAVLATVASLVIAVTGGASFNVWGLVVRAHSVGALLLFLGAWTVCRYLTRRVAFLRIASLPLESVPGRLVSVLAQCRRVFTSVTMRRAWMVAGGVAIAATIARVVLAVVHPGFFSGDDVEIHEMTVKWLFQTEWPIWELRSAFYPMSFVLPAQWVGVLAGVTDIGQLVLAGRLVVVAVSTLTIVLLHATASRLLGAGYGMVAAILLATSSLHIEFGATELPRPVAALFILGAYGCLATRRSTLTVVTAGLLIGIAACLRFSEAVFLLPAFIHLAIEKRWGHVPWLFAAFVASAGSIQVASDLWYWGEPLFSARAMIDFTIVQGLSSRGYDPWWYYLREATSWSDVLVLALAVHATRRNILLAVWVWAPVVVLSALAHKEPRYLIPILPLLSILATLGLASVLRSVERLPQNIAAALAVSLVVAVPLRFIDQASKYHVRRSDHEVRFAQRVAPWLPVDAVVVEQSWRFGGHLYLGQGRDVVDLTTDATTPDELIATVRRVAPSLVLISARTCASTACGAALDEAGFADAPSERLREAGYRAFAPVATRQRLP